AAARTWVIVSVVIGSVIGKNWPGLVSCGAGAGEAGFGSAAGTTIGPDTPAQTPPRIATRGGRRRRLLGGGLPPMARPRRRPPRRGGGAPGAAGRGGGARPRPSRAPGRGGRARTPGAPPACIDYKPVENARQTPEDRRRAVAPTAGTARCEGVREARRSASRG